MHSDVDVCVVGGGPGGLCSLRSSVSGTESCVAAPDHNHVEGVRGLINLHASSPSNQVVARITPHVEEEGAVEPSSPELAAGSRRIGHTPAVVPAIRPKTEPLVRPVPPG